MRWIAYLPIAAATALPAVTLAGVTVAGGGWSVALGEIKDAMAYIESKGNPETPYLVHAMTGKYAAFAQSSNSVLSWGESPGLLVIGGNLSIAGRLIIEVTPAAGLGTGGAFEHDRMLVAGDITLEPGTAIDFAFSPGLVFRHGDSFSLIEAGPGRSILADLDLLRASVTGLPTLPPGNSWQLDIVQGGTEGYGGDSLVLMAVPMPGPAALFALAAVTGTRRRRR